MLFESLAYAMGTPAAGGGEAGNPIMSFMPLILMFVIFYFLLIRPQQKKAKQHKELLGALKKNDYVMTNGGIYGRVVEATEEVLTLDVGNDVQIKVSRNFVAGLAEPPKKG